MKSDAEFVVSSIRPMVHEWLIQKSVTETIEDRCNGIKQKLLSVFQPGYQEPITVDNYWAILSDDDANLYHNAYDTWVEKSDLHVDSRGDCPYLVADLRLVGIENEIIKAGLKAMGHDESLATLMYGDKRLKFIDLCVGMVTSHPSFKEPNKDDLYKRGNEYLKKGQPA